MADRSQNGEEYATMNSRRQKQIVLWKHLNLPVRRHKGHCSVTPGPAWVWGGCPTFSDYFLSNFSFVCTANIWKPSHIMALNRSFEMRRLVTRLHGVLLGVKKLKGYLPELSRLKGLYKPIIIHGLMIKMKASSAINWLFRGFNKFC